jgi:CcmD family protein
MNMKYFFTIALFMLTSLNVFSQQTSSFHESGKIYPVMAVIFIILFGIFFFLIRQDRKLAKLEKELNNK